MISFINMEFSKLKRSKPFFAIVLGSIIPPIAIFLGILLGIVPLMNVDVFFNKIIAYSLLLINIIVFAMLLGFLVVREFRDNTLAFVLSAPISKTKFIVGKFLTFEVLVILLTIFSFILSVIFGCMMGIENIVLNIGKYFLMLLIGNILLSWVLSIFLFIGLISKNIVPGIIISIIVAVANMKIYDLSYAPLFPFSSPLIIVSNKLAMYDYGMFFPVSILLLTAVVGFGLSIFYFVDN